MGGGDGVSDNASVFSAAHLSLFFPKRGTISRNAQR